MKRLQGHCFIASASLHLLLVLTLLLSSAFQNTQPGPTTPTSGHRGEPPPMQLVSAPSQTEAPAATAAQSQPVVVPQPPVASHDIPDLPPPQHDPNSFNPTPKRPRTPHISTNLVSRPVLGARPTSSHPNTTTPNRADQIGQMLDQITRSFSPGTAIDLGSSIGFGSDSGEGGYSYAQIVKEYYSRNWDPRSFASEAGTGLVTVVIASDGKVLQARLTTSSGNKALDDSIQQALHRVQFIQPFEKAAREKQRTYTINFDARARAALE